MIALFIILLIMSAFFSSSETALFHLKSYEDVNEKVKKLISRPQKLLSTLLTGNTIVNIAIGSLGATYTVNHIAKFSSLTISTLLIFEVIIITFLVLIFGEIIPKTYAIAKSKKLANFLSKPLTVMLMIVYPIAFFFHKITDLIIKILPINKEQIFDSEEELMMLAEVGEEEGTLDHEESDMIQSVLEFKNKLVKEILTPRVDVIALDSLNTLDEAMDMIMNKKYSKIPVYKESIDNIKGVLYGIDSVYSHMLERQSGQIINISSVAGKRVMPGSAVYSGTKYAVRAISEGLRLESSGKIQVTCIYPGAFKTELAFSIKDESMLEALMSRGIGNIAQPAERVAESIIYALQLDPGVSVNEIVIRPTAQEA